MCRHQRPAPRDDGHFVPGAHATTVSFSLWKFHGATGECEGEAGMDIATFKGPITEHAKNILRGREKWGLRHPLQAQWAQLPAGKLALAGEAAIKGPPVRKRARKAQPREAPKQPRFS